MTTKDAFGDDAVAGAERGFSKAGLKPLMIEGFDKEKPDFKPFMPRIVKADAQAVMVVGTGASVAKAVHELRGCPDTSSAA